MAANTVLVTGASGLIGQRVARVLTASGRAVLATDAVAAEDSAVAIEVADLRDRDRLAELVSGGLDAIVHCGGFSGPMVGTSAPRCLLDVNVGGTANLLDVGREQGIRRFVFASTATVYGVTTGEFADESVLPRPANIYSASKFASEQLVNGYARHFTGGAFNLRLAWVYGPRRTTDCVIRQMIQDALDQVPTKLPYGEGFPRQFMHVDDVARALVQALDVLGTPALDAYNVTGESRTTLDEVAALVREVLPGADIGLSPGPDPLDVEQAYFHTTAARRDLGFAPHIPLREGIATYAEWLAAHRGQA
ncbi:NAD-dependent epimerase/dehydratase family protein [Streptomyces tendae]|uniref:NAD-dependent epimerase/dehydratase family protein n=1 Tax=Streptomyces tendae TaxID=1932 RepID=UPI0036B5D857